MTHYFIADMSHIEAKLQSINLTFSFLMYIENCVSEAVN